MEGGELKGRTGKGRKRKDRREEGSATPLLGAPCLPLLIPPLCPMAQLLFSHPGSSHYRLPFPSLWLHILSTTMSSWRSCTISSGKSLLPKVFNSYFKNWEHWLYGLFSKYYHKIKLIILCVINSVYQLPQKCRNWVQSMTVSELVFTFLKLYNGPFFFFEAVLLESITLLFTYNYFPSSITVTKTKILLSPDLFSSSIHLSVFKCCTIHVRLAST